MQYSVTAYFSEVIEVEAENENEAINKVAQQLKNMNVVPVPDEYEVKCLEEE